MNTPPMSLRSILRTSVAWAMAGLFVPAAFAANPTWIFTPTDGNWSTAANWSTGVAPVANDTLVFTNSSITTVTNDSITGNINAIIFGAGGDAFTIGGNGFILNGNVTNASANAQVINPDLILNGDRTLVGSAGLTLAGTGTLLNSGGNRTLNNWLTSGNLKINNLTLSEAAGTARTFTLQGDKGSTTISGVIANGSTAASTLTYMGGGIVTMNGAAASTYTGALNVNKRFMVSGFHQSHPSVESSRGSESDRAGRRHLWCYRQIDWLNFSNEWSVNPAG